MALTEKEVFDACDAITADGGKVTQSDVRKITGGSFSTIGTMIKAWRDAQEERREIAVIQPPAEVKAAAEIFEATVWKAAIESAQAGQDAMRKELISMQESIKDERAESAQIIAELESERDNALHDVDSMTKKNEILDAKNEEVCQKNIEQKTETTNAVMRAEASEADAKRLKDDLAAANKQSEQMKSERDAAMSDLAKCREKMSEMSDKKDKIEADTKAEIANIHRTTKEEIEAVRSESKEEIETMRKVKAHLTRVEKITEDLVASTDRAARAEEQVHAQAAEIERLKAGIKDVQKPAKTG